MYIELCLLLDATDSSTTQVREHIENIVESLVGKDLDEVKVIQLFDHPSCKFHKSWKDIYHNYKVGLVKICTSKLYYLSKF